MLIPFPEIDEIQISSRSFVQVINNKKFRFNFE